MRPRLGIFGDRYLQSVRSRMAVRPDSSGYLDVVRDAVADLDIDVGWCETSTPSVPSRSPHCRRQRKATSSRDPCGPKGRRQDRPREIPCHDAEIQHSAADQPDEDQDRRLSACTNDVQEHVFPLCSRPSDILPLGSVCSGGPNIMRYCLEKVSFSAKTHARGGQRSDPDHGFIAGTGGGIFPVPRRNPNRSLSDKT